MDNNNRFEFFTMRSPLVALGSAAVGGYWLELYTDHKNEEHHNSLESKVESATTHYNAAEAHAKMDTQNIRFNAHAAPNLSERLIDGADSPAADQQSAIAKKQLDTVVGIQHRNPNISGTVDGLFILVPVGLGVGLYGLKRYFNYRDGKNPASVKRVLPTVISQTPSARRF